MIERQEELARGIDLAGGLRMRRVSAEDLKDFERTASLFSSDARLSLEMFVIEKSVDSEGPYSAEVNKLVLDTVLALRLLKDRYVSHSYIYYIAVSGVHLVESLVHPEKRRSFYFPEKYVLSLEEVPSLNAILKRLQDMDFVASKNLLLACRRFQRAYEEEDLDDQLVDLMIGFESLFLRGSRSRASQGEVIAIACSHMLGRDMSERDRIREQLKKAYSERNLIVHGVESSRFSLKRVPELFTLNRTIEAYLRDSIKRLLD